MGFLGSVFDFIFVLIGLDNLYESNSRFKKKSGFYAGISIFYINLICIILSILQLKISQK
jgi:hypothetical protein